MITRRKLPTILLGSYLFFPLISVGGDAAALPDTTAGSKDSRTFEFRYGATVVGVPTGATARVWLPVPPSNEHQEVEPLEKVLPFEASIAPDEKYGNQMLFFEAPAGPAGTFAFTTSYRIKRSEVRGLVDADSNPVALTDEQKALFLQANSKVPIAGEPTELIADLKLPKNPIELGRSLYLRVDEWMTYDKSNPGYGNGDVLWACDSRTGNCTDFHSLFISLARNKNIPARFEIGFPLPAERGSGTVGGYHCWAMFYTDGRGWIPVDISEADKNPAMKDYYFGNLTASRVVFTTGRDIQLVPNQQGPPLNYFVYPYVEVEGKAWPKANIQLRLEYTDLES